MSVFIAETPASSKTVSRKRKKEKKEKRNPTTVTRYYPSHPKINI